MSCPDCKGRFFRIIELVRQETHAVELPLGDVPKKTLCGKPVRNYDVTQPVYARYRASTRVSCQECESLLKAGWLE